jgi:hypothetical protein
MDRRSFLKNSAVAAGALIVSPRLVWGDFSSIIYPERFKTPGIREIEIFLARYGFTYVETNQDHYARLEALETGPGKTWHPDYVTWLYKSKQLEAVESGMLEELEVRYILEDTPNRVWSYSLSHTIGNTKQLYEGVDYVRTSTYLYDNLEQFLSHWNSDLHRVRHNTSRQRLCPGLDKAPMPCDEYLAWAQRVGFVSV